MSKSIVNFTSPTAKFLSITPNDGADIASYQTNRQVLNVTRGLLIGTAGTLRCLNDKGDQIDLPVLQGYNPIITNKIFSTGTTAAEIFGLY